MKFSITLNSVVNTKALVYWFSISRIFFFAWIRVVNSETIPSYFNQPMLHANAGGLSFPGAMSSSFDETLPEDYSH